MGRQPGETGGEFERKESPDDLGCATVRPLLIFYTIYTGSSLDQTVACVAENVLATSPEVMFDLLPLT